MESPAGIDYHLHSEFSFDSTTPMEMYTLRALNLGMDEIGFSEHWDFDPEDDGYGTYHYERARETFLRLQEKYRARIQLRFGVEITYQEEREEEILERLRGKEFDYVIGSIHLPEGIAITNPSEAKLFFQHASPEEAYLPYFRDLLNAAKSGIFQILGHFDVFKRYGSQFLGPFHPGEYAREVKAILKEAVRTGTALEINTSGLRHHPLETYPGGEICKMYRDLHGTRFTFGSDAHRVEELSFEYPSACRLLEEVGISEWTTFSKKRAGSRPFRNRPG